jgi:hypothetical protein
MKGLFWRSVLVGLGIAAVLALLNRLGVGLPLLLLLVAALGAMAFFAPLRAVRWWDDLILALRAWYWRDESGRHHSFAGITLDIEEHEGQMWLSADSLQRALRRPEDETTTAARLADHPTAHAWHNDEGLLMLNLQAVVHHLAHRPERMDGRVQRLRRYLERDMLYPASRRAGRSARPTQAFQDSESARR